MIKLLISFKYALKGILYCVAHCRNFRIHTVAAACVLYFSRFYGFDKTVYALLCVLFALVLSLEAMNTALEQTCDAMQKHSEAIMHAKDAAAGAVFIGALFSVAVAYLLFWDTAVFSEIADFFISVPMRLVLLVLFALLSVIYIFYEDIFKNGKQ